GALLLVVLPLTKYDPANPQPPGAIAKYEGPTNFDDVRDSSSGLRARLDGLRESLSFASPNEWLGLDPALERWRQRAETLRRDLRTAAYPSPDLVQTELENIRRRLELLQQHVGYRSE